MRPCAACASKLGGSVAARSGPAELGRTRGGRSAPADCGRTATRGCDAAVGVAAVGFACTARTADPAAEADAGRWRRCPGLSTTAGVTSAVQLCDVFCSTRVREAVVACI